MVDVAILGYRASGNLGDAVQSFALLELLGPGLVTDVVDRDDIASYKPSQTTALAMNGWLTQRVEGLRFAGNVTPRFTSIHLSPQRGMYSSQLALAEILDETPYLVNFLKSFPVGARDMYTLGLLRAAGVESYFSGCVTLLLRPRHVQRLEHILAVDLPRATVERLRKQTDRPVIEVSNFHTGNFLNENSIRQTAEPYLDLLASSHAVVTPRLHAALPAVALGVPVLFAPDDPRDPRFEGLLDFVPQLVSPSFLAELPSSVFEAPFPKPAREISELTPGFEAFRESLSRSDPNLIPESWSPMPSIQEIARASLAVEKRRLEVELAEIRSLPHVATADPVTSLGLHELTSADVYDSATVATLETATSQMCTARQFDEPTYRRILAGLGQNFEYHRKQWEHIYTLRILEQFGLIGKDASGCGFDCGGEPIVAYMAHRGSRVLATGVKPSDGGAGSDGSLDIEDFFYPGICDWKDFSARVTIREVDMKAPPASLGKFDFVWSSCAIERLGSLGNGMDFVVKAMDFVRPGGVAVHTTQLNIDSNRRTLESPTLSLFRWKDIDRLVKRLEARGHRVLTPKRDRGDRELDRYVDAPPYSRRHVKLQVEGFSVTSLGLTIVAGA